MVRRRVVGAGVAAVGVGLVRPGAAWAGAPAGRAVLLGVGVAAGRRLFAAGAYDGLQEVLPVLLEGARRTGRQGPAQAGVAAGVWVLASQVAVKRGRIGQAGGYAERAGAVARASGDPLVLAAAARAAATPLRRAGRAGQALALLQEAHDQLAAGRRAGAAYVDAGGMVALTAAYTAAQARDRSRAVEFAGLAEEMAGRLEAGRVGAAGGVGELSAQQCLLYRVGVHRELGDPDTALAYAARLVPGRLPSPERRARAATDTARALMAAGDAAGAFDRLLQVERAAPLEARRPSVRALAGAVAARRPGLAGLEAYLHRTGVAFPA